MKELTYTFVPLLSPSLLSPACEYATSTCVTVDTMMPLSFPPLPSLNNALSSLALSLVTPPPVTVDTIRVLLRQVDSLMASLLLVAESSLPGVWLLPVDENLEPVLPFEYGSVELPLPVTFL